MQQVTKPKDLEPIEELMRANLERFIGECGYSQQMVADLAGIPQANLGRYVRGENAIPSAIIPPLAEVFGRQPNDFFSASPPSPDMDTAMPVFVRRRPGAPWTDEDQRDTEEYLERIRQRRIKKKASKRG